MMPTLEEKLAEARRRQESEQLPSWRMTLWVWSVSVLMIATFGGMALGFVALIRWLWL
jgi:hypothetical protein